MSDSESSVPSEIGSDMYGDEGQLGAMEQGESDYDDQLASDSEDGESEQSEQPGKDTEATGGDDDIV